MSTAKAKDCRCSKRLANGVPVVLPRHGAFPEMVEATGGGLLTEPDDPRSLADELRRFITDDALRQQCGRSGYDAVRQRFTAELMARQTLELYHRLLGTDSPRPELDSVAAAE
ncbi:MAG: glycosyltransferase family 4 protein [Pirellulales bacterium]